MLSTLVTGSADVFLPIWLLLRKEGAFIVGRARGLEMGPVFKFWLCYL